MIRISDDDKAIGWHAAKPGRTATAYRTSGTAGEGECMIADAVRARGAA
jgi:hypothetical protein